MKNNNLILMLLFLLFASTGFCTENKVTRYTFKKSSKNKKSSVSNNIKEIDLNELMTIVSSLTGSIYHIDSKLHGKAVLNDDYKLTKENADHFFSKALNYSGYTRIPRENKGFNIIHARDIRYETTPTYELSDKIPDNYDYIMASYKTKYVSTTEITRTFRPFMSRYGRIIDIKNKGIIVIQDTARNVKRLKGLLKKIDIKNKAVTQMNNDQIHSKLKEEINNLKRESQSNKRKISLLERKMKN